MEKRSGPAAASMNPNGSGAAAGAPPLKKDRHIVTWTPEEDELLREQISLHGTENWTSIAAQFKDKTSRQCRRRWYTYLNTQCKKGGWSAEEDMLLCEAQKIFGNRWTEIAKVVSGRTDNAVKNRFSTICKKRAKLEASTKENRKPFENPSNKRLLVQNSCTAAVMTEPTAVNKHIRYHISNIKENSDKRSPGGNTPNESCSRKPLLIVQNFHADCGFTNSMRRPPCDASVHNGQGSFLKRDDPKFTALLQQAELLSFLSMKVNADHTEQSLDDAWKELQDFLTQAEEMGSLGRKLSGMNFRLNELKDLIGDLENNITGEEKPLRQSNFHEDSHESSQYSTGSRQQVEVTGIRTDHQIEHCSTIQDSKVAILDNAPSSSLNPCSEAVLSPIGKPGDDENSYSITVSDYTSPLPTILPFQSFEDGIPSPVFTTSERQFLLSVLDRSSPGPSSNSWKQPSCKRVLLDRLH